jgi:hypothetical protein
MTEPAAFRAQIEAILEGVPLPATKQLLVHYAKREGDGELARRLKRELDVLAKKRFGMIDEVGEALAPVQPSRTRMRRMPKPESGPPPGGHAYAVDAEVRR